MNKVGQNQHFHHLDHQNLNHFPLKDYEESSEITNNNEQVPPNLEEIVQ